MKEPKITDLKKYLSAMQKINKKYISAERLSKVVGVYPQIISETLLYFEPTLLMDPDYNLLTLVPQIKEYIVEAEEKKALALTKKQVSKKKRTLEYDSVGDFIYKKMTIAGGLIDKSATLTTQDLKDLRKLVNQELAKRK